MSVSERCSRVSLDKVASGHLPSGQGTELELTQCAWSKH